MKRHLLHVLTALPLLLPAACEQRPTREVEAAQAQVETARKEGAEQYAPDRWREAQEALQAARERIDDKDYRGAISSANLAAERARSAVQAIRSARALARGRTEVAQAEVRAILEELESIRREAAAARVPEEAFAECAPRAREVQDALERLGATIEKADPLQAQREAADLKAGAADLPTAFRQAQAKWQAEHRQTRRRRR